ncbi:hypothetical protein AQUCO_12600004v1 [Aquilegia coerulea]|uniref:2'-phosphotransferase n=1 Tax=Aquilegia coerulea TaxID=218851 RepID=A0A2G5C1D3_AQUCA|nr:hypothetical protein AQUCO_12600004v1 [Aquilegia coerulea]
MSTPEVTRPLRGYNMRRKLLLVDLNVPPGETLEENTPQPTQTVAQGRGGGIGNGGSGSQTNSQTPQGREGANTGGSGSQIPVTIDVEAIDDEVVISSPTQFAEARKKSRRSHNVSLVRNQVSRSHPGNSGSGQAQGRGGGNTGQGRGGGNTNDDHLDKLFVGLDIRDQQPKRPAGRGQGGSTTDNQINALGRLLTRILRHMASQLKLNMRSDGYVRVDDILKLNMKTFANIPLSSHTVDDIREAVRKDNKQRFGLFDENGELFIRANQGHTIASVESESLLKPILSAEEAPVCVHGTYKRNLESILQSSLKRMERLHIHFSSGLPTDGKVISGMRRDVNVLIFMDIRKALEDGMKIYISENKVILTEGFDGVVPVKYFEKIVTWPKRHPIPF